MSRACNSLGRAAHAMGKQLASQLSEGIPQSAHMYQFIQSDISSKGGLLPLKTHVASEICQAYCLGSYCKASKVWPLDLMGICRPERSHFNAEKGGTCGATPRAIALRRGQRADLPPPPLLLFVKVRPPPPLPPSPLLLFVKVRPPPPLPPSPPLLFVKVRPPPPLPPSPPLLFVKVRPPPPPVRTHAVLVRLGLEKPKP